MNLKFFSIFLILLTGIINNTNSHKCIHDKLKFPLNNIYTRETEPNRSPNWKPIRLKFDFSYLKVVPKAKHYMQYHLFPKVEKFFQKFLSVDRINNRKIIHNQKKCFDLKIPKHYISKGVINYDMVIFIGGIYNKTIDTIAYSGACTLLKNEKNRPFLAEFFFNMYYFNSKLVEGIFQIVIHELFHCLGFSNDLYPYFVDSNGKSLGEEKVWESLFWQLDKNQIILPKVVEVGKKYFNCNSLTGVRLEDFGAGSASSHWENAVLMEEVMSPTDFYESVLSDFTLALFDSMGWYKVDYSVAGKMEFGRNAGCKFQKELCYSKKKFKEYCDEYYSQGCTFDHKFMSICETDAFFNGCPVNFNIQNRDCRNAKLDKKSINYEKFGNVYGINSRCFVSNIMNKHKKINKHWRKRDGTRCFQSYCKKKSNGEKYVKIITPSEVLFCYKGDNWASVSNENNEKKYIGNLKCPDIDTFCYYHNSNCPNSCYGRGSCVNGKCNCHFVYEGKDCSVLIGKFNYPKKKKKEEKKKSIKNKSKNNNVSTFLVGVMAGFIVILGIIYKNFN